MPLTDCPGRQTQGFPTSKMLGFALFFLQRKELFIQGLDIGRTDFFRE